MGYDLVIRHGEIVDGSGLPSFRADLGVVGGRIAKIGRINERGKQEINAEGHVVSPGFVDGHTHMDAQINWDPLGTSSCWQGVTTAVMGNCGFTLAPSRHNQRELVVRNLERAEDISGEAIAAGVKWDWESYPEYLDVLDRLPKGINYAAYLGHSALRTWAMGERAFEQEASDDDLALMGSQLRDGLKAGAIGLSTSRNSQHTIADNRPVASRNAAWSEVRHLVGIMGQLGAGIFELAMERAARIADAEIRNEALGRVQALALDTGVPVTWGLTVSGSESAEAWKAQLDLLDSTAALGGRMFGQSHSRDVKILMSFRSKLPFDHIPEWREVRTKSLDEQKRLLRDPKVRDRLVRAAHQADYSGAIGAEARRPSWERLWIYDKPLPPYTSVAQRAAAMRVDPVEVMIDLALQTDLAQFFMQSPNEENPEGSLKILRHPRTVMTFSDTGAHVTQISDCSIHMHLLAYWVRERQIFTLEEGVRMITLAPARAWGFSDRGLLREGMAADINIFDPVRLMPELPVLVADLPGGAKRLIQRSTGILATIVNGKVLLRDGQHTGELPGRLLRGPLATA